MWRISVFCLASSRLKTSRNGEISKPSTGNASPISGLTGKMKNRQTTLFSVTFCQGTVQCHSEIEPGQDDTPKFLAELSTLKVWLWHATYCDMSSNICWRIHENPIFSEHYRSNVEGNLTGTPISWGNGQDLSKGFSWFLQVAATGFPVMNPVQGLPRMTNQWLQLSVQLPVGSLLLVAAKPEPPEDQLEQTDILSKKHL